MENKQDYIAKECPLCKSEMVLTLPEKADYSADRWTCTNTNCNHKIVIITNKW